MIDLRFEEELAGESACQRDPAARRSQTKIRVSITLKKSRDRRRDDVLQRAQQVLVSFRSYLMATKDVSSTQGVFHKAKSLLAPWLAKD